MNGARWAQRDLLAKQPTVDARVLVIWFRMYPGDERSRWPHEIFTDRRVEQRWDEPKAAGKWFLTHLSDLRPTRGGDGLFPQRVDAMWDTYLLFDRGATWTSGPTSVLSWGYPVMRTRQTLADDFAFAVSHR